MNVKLNKLSFHWPFVNWLNFQAQFCTLFMQCARNNLQSKNNNHITPSHMFSHFQWQCSLCVFNCWEHVKRLWTIWCNLLINTYTVYRNKKKHIQSVLKLWVKFHTGYFRHSHTKGTKAVTGVVLLQKLQLYTLFTPKGCIHTIKVDFSRPT